MYNTLTKENTAAPSAPGNTNLGDLIRQTMEIQEKTRGILDRIMSNVIGSAPVENESVGGACCMMEAAEIIRDNAGRILDDVSHLAQLL